MYAWEKITKLPSQVYISQWMFVSLCRQTLYLVRTCEKKKWGICSDLSLSSRVYKCTWILILNLSKIPGSARTCCIFFVPINWCATVGHLIHRVNSSVSRADHSCDKITTTLNAWAWRSLMNREMTTNQLSGQKPATKACKHIGNCFERARNLLTFSVG